ncbi:MAG: hypothetical protein WD073_09000 [Xanthobacteraceae bacterium]
MKSHFDFAAGLLAAAAVAMTPRAAVGQFSGGILDAIIGARQQAIDSGSDAAERTQKGVRGATGQIENDERKVNQPKTVAPPDAPSGRPAATSIPRAPGWDVEMRVPHGPNLIIPPGETQRVVKQPKTVAPPNAPSGTPGATFAPARVPSAAPAGSPNIGSAATATREARPLNALAVHVQGDVKYQRAGETGWRPLKPGDKLQDGDVVKTGLKSRAVVQLGNTQVEVKPLGKVTMTRFLEIPQETKKLDRGGLSVTVPKDRPRIDMRPAPATKHSTPGG